MPMNAMPQLLNILSALALIYVLAGCAPSNTGGELGSIPFDPSITLTSIDIEDVTLNRPFDAKISQYSAEVSKAVSRVVITPNSDDAALKIKVNNINTASGTSQTILLDEGENSILVSVSNGEKASVYVFTITRASRRFLSTDSTLSALQMSSGSLMPPFSSDRLSYSVAVANSVDTISLTASFNQLSTATINNASLTSDVASSSFPLAVGNNNVINILVTAEDRSTTNYTITITRFNSNIINLTPKYRVDLKNLLISTGELSPAFSSEIKRYTSVVEYSTKYIQFAPITADPATVVTINAKPTSPGQSTEPLALAVGDNQFEIKVKAPDKSENIYKITLVREKSLDSNTELRSLAVSAGALSPAFDTTVFDYAMTVPNEVDSIALTPTATSPLSSILINGKPVISGQATGNFPLQTFDNRFDITVLALDGGTQTYQLTITREIAGLGTVTDLLSLTLSTNTTHLVIDENAIKQTIPLGYSSTSLRITPTLRDNTATMILNGQPTISGRISRVFPLEVGDTILNLIVTAANNSTKTYTIVARRSRNPDLNNISLSVGFLDQVFQETLTEYTASVGHLADTLRLSASTLDSEASLNIAGSAASSGEMSQAIALNQGSNLIDIKVTTPDQSSQTYTLDVTRQSPELLSERHYIKAANSSGKNKIDRGPRFGMATALLGNTLVVSAPFESSASTTINGDSSYSCDSNFFVFNCSLESGAVYVFVRDKNGWTQQAYIKASDAGEGDQFGTALDLGENILIVGAPFRNNRGAVYVYRRTGSSWVEEAILTSSNIGDSDNFGNSVAISGNTLVVGASAEDAPGKGLDDVNISDDYGAAYVFNYASAVWAEQEYLKSPTPDIGDGFGSQVDIDGDILVVSAIAEDSDAININGSEADNTLNDAGAVYVFKRTDNVWEKDAYIKAFNTSNLQFFGSQLALSGNTLAVSSPGESGSGNGVNAALSTSGIESSGAVYLYYRDTSGSWRTGEYIKSANPGVDDFFGHSLALRGNSLVVGASQEDSGQKIIGVPDDNSASNAGAVYVYSRTDDIWSFSNYLKASNAQANDQFGQGISVDGDSIAIGAPFEDGSSTAIINTELERDIDNFKQDAGSVYVFR
ncbi:MAG TPA: hypothetical protein ENK06_02580 [Gammaproteobacteria bacterium]|nr:hypothetical protein [Gammaproteobacteria bacterium]